ncbi:MAG: haloacid dehalogenase type II, partial [Pseudomonadota bacterium]
REALAETWQALSNHWRSKQLQYTWLRAITGDHTDFWTVTQDALDWAMAAVNLRGEDHRARLLELYWQLGAYPEVPQMLRDVKAAGCRTAILSNGSPDMLDGAVQSAGIGPLLDAILSVESVQVFKPNARVYDLVGGHFGTDRDDVLFVSSNGWDAASAAAYGFQTAWVNRAGEPRDRLPGAPNWELSDLTGIPTLVETA